jgi:hypothetical protein
VAGRVLGAASMCQIKLRPGLLDKGDLYCFELSQCPQDLVDVGCVGLHDQQELGTSARLEAVQVKGIRVQDLNARAVGLWRQLRGDGVQGVPVAGTRRQRLEET